MAAERVATIGGDRVALYVKLPDDDLLRSKHFRSDFMYFYVF